MIVATATIIVGAFLEMAAKSHFETPSYHQASATFWAGLKSKLATRPDPQLNFMMRWFHFAFKAAAA